MINAILRAEFQKNIAIIGFLFYNNKIVVKI
jgi:hypothetical protein